MKDVKILSVYYVTGIVSYAEHLTELKYVLIDLEKQSILRSSVVKK